MNILVVEENISIANLLKHLLENDGFNVSLCETLSDAQKFMLNFQFDIVILDLLLPDGNGLNLCQEIKKNKKKYEKPLIIFITANKEEAFLMESFSLGAVDYLRKPFNLLELTLKIAGLTEILEPSSNKLKYNEIEIDRNSIKVFENFTEVSVTKLEYDFLYFLVKNKGRVFSREKLIELVWQNKWAPTDRAVDQCVKKLRKKFKTLHNKIETVHGLGYKIKN